MTNLTMACAPLKPVYQPARPDEFKNGMRRLAGAVCIVTVKRGLERAGLTATAVVSISAEPPRLMVCVNRNVFAHDLLQLGGALCVNVLGQENLEEAKRFAGMIKGVSGDSRFTDGRWVDDSDAAPELENTLATFQCRTTEIISASSHSMVMCEVVEVRITHTEASPGMTERPLVYFDGRFGSVCEL